MAFRSADLRKSATKSASIKSAITLAFAITACGLAASGAQAQSAYWWAPTPGYGYVPPMPIYRQAPSRYIPGPVYPREIYQPDVYEPAPRARPLNPAQVRSMLNQRGLRVTGAPQRNGGVYVADVRDRTGAERRLIIDGYYGRVLQTFPGGAARHGRPAQGPQLAGRPLDPDVDTDVIMPGSGPRVIPGIGGLEKPGVNQPKKKKPVKKIAAKPPAAKTAPSALPAQPPPAATIDPPIAEPALPPAAISPAPEPRTAASDGIA